MNSTLSENRDEQARILNFRRWERVKNQEPIAQSRDISNSVPIAGPIALPVQVVRPQVPIAAAQQILDRAGSGLSVVDDQGKFIGAILRRDLDLALHYGFGAASVQDHLTPMRSIQQDSNPPEDAAYRLEQLRQWLQPALWQVLTIAAQQAQDQGCQLYLVGGAVRDLSLALGRADRVQSELLLQDIDLVVDGLDRSADAAAGVELARSLQAAYPQARLEIHRRFQTAAIVWHNDPDLQRLGVDIATARTEVYPYPAANPVVSASSIRQDLYRRDFTINALAIRLTQPQPGELLDFFGGWQDLQDRQIRVLHANSVIEDPTRIFRAVRFATRLGFQLEPQTEGYIRSAIASGLYARIHDRIQHDRLIAPALQTRLRSELKYLLQSSYWQAGLAKLADLQALQCIHPRLSMSRELWQQLRRAGRIGARGQGEAGGRGAGGQGGGGAGGKEGIVGWLLVLEVLLAGLKSDDRVEAAESLQLPIESCDRLQGLALAETEISQALPTCQRPSQKVGLFDRYPKPLLVLVGLRGDRATRRVLWRYWTDWTTRDSFLSGKDLKALGYRPGAQFKQILAALKIAALDGQVTDRASAIGWIQQEFPRN